jgi:protein gp37
MGDTSIEWTDKTWSPLRVRVKADAACIARDKGYTSLVQIAEKMAGHVGPHCEHISPGCENCYSGTNNSRCLPANGTGLPFDRRSRDLVDPVIDEQILLQPLKWRAPKRIFVENQSDLFGEWISVEHQIMAFRTILSSSRHTYQILTKRPAAMLERIPIIMNRLCGMHWRMPDNIWLGVSVENQETADARIPLLLQTPAAVRFLSVEPLLGPLDLGRFLFCAEPCNESACACRDRGGEINWAIVGGESGPGARPMDIRWARDIVAQCEAADVPCFVKQLGRVPMMDEDAWHLRVNEGRAPLLNPNNARLLPAGHLPLKLKDRKGGDMAEWPADLQVRQFPEARA